MKQSCLLSFESQFKRAINPIHTDSVKSGFFTVNVNLIAGLIFFHVPVHIDHTGRLFKDFHNISGDLFLTLIIGTVNFGHQSGQHWRTGRDFSHFYSGTIPVGDAFENRSNPFGNIMTLIFSMPFLCQIDLDICLVSTAS